MSGPVATEAWITSVVVDCVNPEALASFWSQLLGLDVRPRTSRYVALARPPRQTPELVFQPVTEPKRGKVRIHLDIGVPDVDGAVRRAVALGATAADDVDSADDPNLRVLRDPEGNEFCLIHRGPDEP